MSHSLSPDIRKFFAFIRLQPCYFAGIVVKHRRFPFRCNQGWNDDLGEYQSEVSHILRKGSTRRNEHFGNVFPNCREHHEWFETLTPDERAQWLNMGQVYLQLYFSEHTMTQMVSM